MPNELIACPDPSPALCLPVDRVQNYLENARARNTIKGYRSSFRQFQAWCNRAGLVAMPATPETVALYISAQAEELRPSTLEHHLAAIAKAHKAAGVPSPIQDNLLVRETLKGIKRVHGTALSQKAPVLTEDLRMMLRLVPRNVQGIRDRALLLVGFAGAFRRSELVALDVTDLQFTPEGLLLALRRSKTDQEGAGRSVAIAHGTNPETCPIQAVKHWLETVNLSEGAVFRPVRKGGQVLLTRLTGHAVALVVKKYAKPPGCPPKRFLAISCVPASSLAAQSGTVPENNSQRAPYGRVPAQSDCSALGDPRVIGLDLHHFAIRGSERNVDIRFPRRDSHSTPLGPLHPYWPLYWDAKPGINYIGPSKKFGLFTARRPTSIHEMDCTGTDLKYL